MFGIGPGEFIVIAIVAILFIGPDKLPETMKKFGRFFVQARRHANDVKDTFQQVIHDAERELEIERIRQLQREIQSVAPNQVIEAEIKKALAATPEEDHAPHGAESFHNQDNPEHHDHGDNPDFIRMDYFEKAKEQSHQAAEAAAKLSTEATTAQTPAKPNPEPAPSAAPVAHAAPAPAQAAPVAAEPPTDGSGADKKQS